MCLLNDCQVQIKGWLHRNRKRANALAAQQDEKEILFSEVVEGDHDEDIDLLSQTCDGELSQISEVSENSTSLLSEFSRATTVEETQVYRRGLEISAVTGLIDGALQIFIGGHYRRIVLPPGVKLVKPAPKICLSKLVPNLFNPGYREVQSC